MASVRLDPDVDGVPDGVTQRLLGPAEIREIAGRLGVRPSKRLGQNFVVDPGTVRRIVALSEVGPGDVVLEVGPGFGSLTFGLLGAARRVVGWRWTRCWRRNCRAPWPSGPRIWRHG